MCSMQKSYSVVFCSLPEFWWVGCSPVKWVTQEAPRWPSQPQEETLWPSDLRAEFSITEVKWGSKAGKGALSLEVPDLQPRAKTQSFLSSPNPSPPRFFSKSNKFWPVIIYAPPNSSKSAFVQENRELFSLPYQCPRKGEKRSGLLSAPCLGTMKRWKQAPRVRGCHFRPTECLQGPGKEVVEEGLRLACWKHNSSLGWAAANRKGVGRIWAQLLFCSCCHSHSLWSAGKWHFVPWDKCLVRGCGRLWKGIRIKDEGGL